MFLTGTASGIGRHLAERFAAAGWRVTAADVMPQAPLPGPEGRVRAKRLDVTDAGAFERALAEHAEAFGGLDVCVNNAGVITPARVIDSDPALVDRHVDVNLKGVLYGTTLAARIMRSAGRGHIINIASMAGVAPVPGIGAYTASKFGVRGWSLVAAEELREHGIAVTVIGPDLVDTPMLDLQLEHPEAAITFSGPGALSVGRIGDAVFGALRGRPVEVLVPAHRGWLSKLASAFPGLIRPLRRRMERKGAAAAARLRDHRRGPAAR